jgi:hypothetical protein
MAEIMCTTVDKALIMIATNKPNRPVQGLPKSSHVNRLRESLVRSLLVGVLFQMPCSIQSSLQQSSRASAHSISSSEQANSEPMTVYSVLQNRTLPFGFLC